MNTGKKIKAISATLVLLLAGMPWGWAQQTGDAAAETAKPVQLPEILFEPTFYIWVLLGVIVFAVIIALARAVNVLSRMLEESTGSVRTTPTEMKEYVRRETAWTSFMNILTRSVPVEKEEDVMLHHDYDGIRELDNKLPPWWVWGFYVTIIFSVVYLVSYHVSGSGKLQLEEYNEQMQQAALQKEAMLAKNRDMVTAENVTLLTEASAIADGKGVFEKNCAACHKSDGGGSVGPNLTDQYWIHGGSIKNIFATITEGVPAKGMISWKSQLSPKQIQQLSSYIVSLRGTNPPDAKEPQGDIWVEEGAAAPADSTAAKTDSAAVVKS